MGGWKVKDLFELLGVESVSGRRGNRKIGGLRIMYVCDTLPPFRQNANEGRDTMDGLRNFGGTIISLIYSYPFQHVFELFQNLFMKLKSGK